MNRMFSDRQAAGKESAQRLTSLAGRTDTVVLGLPRGGLPVALEIAKDLGAPLDVVLVRKIGSPMNPELALGAVSGPNGKLLILNSKIASGLSIAADSVEQLAAPQRAELLRRSKLWGAGAAAVTLRNKVVVLVDDGIATGATMRAAIAAVRASAPARIIVATPVAAPDSLLEIARLADDVVCLQSPAMFVAVGAHYAQFPQVTDDEVREILASTRSSGGEP